MKNEKQPEIRFPDFKEIWSQRKFEDFISKAGKKNNTGKNFEAYSVNNKVGLIRQADQFDGSRLDDLDKTSYKLVNQGEFAYNPARINVGSIAFNSLSETVIISSLYVVLKMSEKLDNEFILQFIKSPIFNNEVRRNTEGSVREYLFFESFKNIRFPFPPNKVEQTKIGEFFKQLDEIITLHEQELEMLKQTKQGFLQKMFPKEGELVPEFRFPGFTEDWGQYKIQWLIDEAIIEKPMDGNHGEKHPTASDYVDYGIPFLMARDIKNGIVDFQNCNFISKERSEKLDKGFAKNGDVLITHKATIGEIAILNGLSSEYAILTPQVTYYRVADKSKLATKYLYAYFISPEFQSILKTKSTQSTRSYMGITAQYKLDIKLPKEIKEQEKIGEFFSDLDNLIILHQKELDALKQTKKAFLQKMFV